MAYVSKELKQQINEKLKAYCKPLGIKYSLAVRNHMALVMTIRQSPIDFIGAEFKTLKIESDINETEEQFAYRKEKFLEKKHFNFHGWNSLDEMNEETNILYKINEILNVGNFNNSDVQTDYFSVGWYTDLQVGTWEKPYIHIQ